MARLEIGKHLASDTRVCGGRLIFRGTRIMVADALELLAGGYSPEEVAKQYRGMLSAGAVREALGLTRRGLVREVTVRKAA
jgi:uncharacterized protein (DUF433 family)